MTRIGIVDVPGHRRFIKTMLAGAHGIDFVLFLVAADDSVMPQTREHLQILRLFGVEHGIIVLTKIDLVDEELREMAEAEARDLVANTFLEDAPLIPISSITGQGIPELEKAIDDLASSLKPRDRGTYFRMWVDRAFSVAGAGRVVTGTALSGSAAPGDELEILPEGGRARIRKCEVHGESVERTRAGQRSAINLRLVDKAAIKRGDMLATPDKTKPTYIIDAKLEVLADYHKPLKHWTRVRFHIGTRESFGRVVLLDSEEAMPGSSVCIQLRLESPTPAVAGAPCIIPDFSASRTIGGGKVLDAHPVKHRRKRRLVVGDLERRESGYLEEVIELEVKKAGYFVSRSEIANSLDAPLDRVGAALSALSGQGKVIILPPKKSPWIIHHQAWERFTSRLITILRAHHTSLPQLATGLHEQELRHRMSRVSGTDLPSEPFRHALEKLAGDQALKPVESTFALSEHTASLGETDQAALAGIRALYAENSMMPPATEEVYEQSNLPKAVVREFLEKLISEGELLRVSREFLFQQQAVETAREQVLQYISDKGAITVSDFRDLVGTSRKYAIPLLSYFDSQGFTIRDGDLRRPGPRKG